MNQRGHWLALFGGLATAYMTVPGLFGGWWHPALFTFLCAAGVLIVGLAETVSEGVFLGECVGCSCLEHEVSTWKAKHYRMVETVCDVILDKHQLPKLEE